MGRLVCVIVVPIGIQYVFSRCGSFLNVWFMYFHCCGTAKFRISDDSMAQSLGIPDEKKYNEYNNISKICGFDALVY